MNVSILGGSFDPPHIGHYFLALQIKEQLLLDQVWLVPCSKHPFTKQLSSAKHRLLMTKFLETDWLKVSDVEIKKETVSYSIDTLRELSQIHPTISFSWIIGSDQLEDFPKWKDWKKIILDFGLIVFPRGVATHDITEKTKQALGFSSLPSSLRIIEETNVVRTTVSSTIIRKRLKEGKSITHMVPKKVEKYIIKHTLYG